MPPAKKDDIVSCHAESFRGNNLICGVFRNSATGDMSLESIQPDEQSPSMMALHHVCSAAHESLLVAVQEHFTER